MLVFINEKFEATASSLSLHDCRLIYFLTLLDKAFCYWCGLMAFFFFQPSSRVNYIVEKYFAIYDKTLILDQHVVHIIMGSWGNTF